MLAIWIALYAVCFCKVSANSTIAECPRSPGTVSEKDVNYQLGIAGEPNLFLPGELYTVTLQGIDSGKGPTPFIGFTIWAELENEVVEADTKETNATSKDNQPLGTFQAYDAQTKVQETCAPSVENATAHPKTEIQVIWNAPIKPAVSCVRICARAGPSDQAGAWSMLAHKLCPAPSTPGRFTAQPPIVEPCCACDEAKYEVTFEGLWSRNTHPREFPAESARAHFGDVIGASHTAQYRVWQEGRVASNGLRRLADDGATTALEKELKAESEHIRTIIKARGISWQQVATAINPATFAVFRADARHHLVSLASKLAPSPDWLVGVSALELCEKNCTWRDAISVPLYPYDAGFDNGISYVNRRRQPTIPAAPVRALRPDWPADVRSPFYSTAGEMRPFARLKLTRLRLYEKNCDATHTNAANDAVSLAPGGSCTTHTWGAWSPCSVSCGRGRATRQRRYVWPLRARADACRVPLTDYKQCYGPRRHCRAPTEYEPDPAESTGPCAVSEWSEWSPCEGCGVRARTRHYLAPKAHKRCHVGYRARMVMSQAMPCDAGPCYKPPPQFANATNFDWFYVDKFTGQCEVTAWGEWSPCSARCGRGRRMRTRLYIAPREHASRLQPALTRHLMNTWNKRFAEIQHLDLPSENVTSDPELEKEVQEFMERCQFTLTQQEALCDGDRCADTAVSPETCELPSDVGHCRGYEERWFFDAHAGNCEPFGYSGCGGNNNNFRNRDECVKACGNITLPSGLSTKRPVMATTTTTTTASSADNEVMQADASAKESVHCRVSPWIGWSECAGACDYAFKLNFRRIVHNGKEGGKPCPHLVRIRKCIPKYCRGSSSSSSSRGRYSRD